MSADPFMPGWLIMVSILMVPGVGDLLLTLHWELVTTRLLFLLSLQLSRPVVHRLHLRILIVLVISATSILSARRKLTLEPLMAAMLLVVARKSAIPELVWLWVVMLLSFMLVLVMVRFAWCVRCILLWVASSICILVLGVMIAAMLWFLVMTLWFSEKELVVDLCVTQVCRVVTSMRCIGTMPDIPDMREDILEEWTVLSTLLLLVATSGRLGLMLTLKRLLAKNLVIVLATRRLLIRLLLRLTFRRRYY